MDALATSYVVRLRLATGYDGDEPDIVVLLQHDIPCHELAVPYSEQSARRETDFLDGLSQRSLSVRFPLFVAVGDLHVARIGRSVGGDVNWPVNV